MSFLTQEIKSDFYPSFYFIGHITSLTLIFGALLLSELEYIMLIFPVLGLILGLCLGFFLMWKFGCCEFVWIEWMLVLFFTEYLFLRTPY